MDLGTILLFIAFGLIISDIILLLFHNRILNWSFWDNIVIYIASIAYYGAFLDFILNLVFQDTSYAYVTGYSSTEMDIPLRIASSWAGDVGSFFLWTTFMFTGFLIFRILFRRMITQQIYQYASMIQGINLLAFLTFILMKDPFSKNLVPVQGVGLNPLLATFLNLIHPPIIFTGYSIFLIPFSIALAKLITQLNDNEAPAELQKFMRFTMALGWLILGTGILIGGYWAYTELGWGGFWAWDPVETGSLIPWLFALVFFHGSPVFKGDKGNFGKDLIATFPFISVLFATIVTRTGLLSSPHAFGATPSDNIIILYLLLIIVVLGFALFRLSIKTEIKKRLPLALSGYKFAIPIPKFIYDSRIKFFYSFEELKSIKRQDAALYISFFAFFLGTIAIATGLVIPLLFALLPAPFNQTFYVDKKYFNIIIGLFGFGALEAAFFTDFVFIKTDNNKLIAIAIGVMAGITNIILNLPITNYYLTMANIGILYNLLHILGTTSLLANFMLPILVMSFIILLITVYKFATSKEMQKQVKMRKISQTFLHLGIVIALIGALISYNTTIINDVQLNPYQSGNVTTTNNVQLVVLDTNYSQNQLNYIARLQTHVKLIDVLSMQNQTINGNQTVVQTVNQTLGEGILDYTNYIDFGVIVNVLIISSQTSDYYITIMDFNNTVLPVKDIMFQIRIIPMINLLWFGASVVMASMLVLVLISFRLFIYSYRKSQKSYVTQEKTVLHNNNPVKGVI